MWESLFSLQWVNVFIYSQIYSSMLKFTQQQLNAKILRYNSIYLTKTASIINDKQGQYKKQGQYDFADTCDIIRMFLVTKISENKMVVKSCQNCLLE